MLYPYDLGAKPLSRNTIRRATIWYIAHLTGWRGEKQIIRMQRRGWRHRSFRD